MTENKYLSGGKLAGGNSERGRVKNDYYATPTNDVLDFFDKLINRDDEIDIRDINTILEPAGGGGHMIDALSEIFVFSDIDSVDIEPKRDDIIQADFLSDDNDELINKDYDLVITNPPFKLAKEFIDKSLEISNRYVMYYLKIQFLEGINRKEWFRGLPLKYVYVYSYRSNPHRNGSPVDENGKKWSSTVCYAWYVFDHEYKGEPIIRWI